MTDRESAAAPAVRLAVLKLGGSLFTDKCRTDSFDEEALRRLAALLARRRLRVNEPILVVLGGGSIGHGVAKALRVHEGFGRCDAAGLHRMTGRMYALKCVFADMLAAEGVAALPLQETSCLVSDANGRIAFHDVPLRRALALGLLPILSGGLVFDTIAGVLPLNGDLIATALDPNVFQLRRVVMLTDSRGVLRTDGRLITHLDSTSCKQMANRTTRDRLDVTGGMAAKVQAALSLAKEGTPTVIASGHDLDDDRFDVLMSGVPDDCSLAGFMLSTRDRGSPIPV
jgi:isopentenyl phosphate kinase